MDVIQEILKFDKALGYGHYPRSNRTILGISMDEAMELWWEMKTGGRKRYPVFDMHTLEVAFVEEPDALPRPIPGKIWGHVYGIRVYVEED